MKSNTGRNARPVISSELSPHTLTFDRATCAERETMNDLKEIKIEMGFTDSYIMFRPLGIGHSPTVWKIVSGMEKPPFVWSGLCLEIEAVTATLGQITADLEKIGFTPVFVPSDFRT